MRLLHPRFTVTAGAIVLDSKNRVLLLRHRFRLGSGWGIPGGFMEAGEQPVDAVKRELQEEVGLQIGSAELAGARSLRHVRQVEILFLCNVPDAQLTVLKPNGSEVLEAQWFSTDSLPAGLPRDQETLLRDILVYGAKRPG